MTTNETGLAVLSELLTEFNLTDSGNAERFEILWGWRVHYSYERKMWLVWTGSVWQWDSGETIAELVLDTMRALITEANKLQDAERRSDLITHALKSESEHRINAMTNLARSKRHIPTKVDQLDADPWLLNCHNGTIDLTTGELLPHNPDHLITKIITTDYDSGARSQVWDDFLAKIFNGDTELISYVQRAMGYSITGKQSEMAFFFCYGSGWNGKSTFLGAIQDVLGPYAQSIEPAHFMVSKNGNGTGPNEGIASLHKARFAPSTELEDGQRLSVSLIKRMTGGEKLHCERKYEHGYDFQPEYKLWLSGNHEPIITDTTASIWLRIKKIPFVVSIPEAERRRDFRQVLSGEHSRAILAWLVKGCLDWQQKGLGSCQAVKAATETYRQEQDVLHQFLTECCLIKKSEIIKVAELYGAYKAWADENNSTPLGSRTFGDRLREKGLVTAAGHGNKTMWLGIRLLTDDEKVNQVSLVNPLSEKSYTKENIEESRENSLPTLTNLTNAEGDLSL